MTSGSRGPGTDAHTQRRTARTRGAAARPADGAARPARVDPDGTVSSVRRALGERSLEAFAQTYLPHHFRVRGAPCVMHQEMFALLERMAGERGLRVAIAAPRNHAKSTIVSLAFALWCVATQREPFIVLVSDTADQAQDHLAQIRRELEENERLREDFPELGLDRGRGDGPRAGTPRRWRRNDLQTRPTERQPGGVRALALGAEQKVRGRRNRAERPSLIIGDDLENEEIVRRAERREKRRHWFHGTLMKAGSVEMNAVVAGTILHHDSILARLVDPVQGTGWLGRRYPAVVSWADRGDLWDRWEAIDTHREEFEGRAGPAAAVAFFEARRDAMLGGAAVLWDAQHSYLRLMQMRVREGRAAFATEMQNEPMDPRAMVFRDEDLHYWDDLKAGGAEDWRALLERLRADDHVSIVGACDPSLGRSGIAGDFTAIITLLHAHRARIAYVVGADIRRLRPDRIIEAILDNDRLFSYSTFAVETVQFQEMLRAELERRARERGRWFNLRGVKQTQDKVARIQSIAPIIAAGGVRFSRRHTLLLEQLRQFPAAPHDDAPDALELALRTAPTCGYLPARPKWGAMA